MKKVNTIQFLLFKAFFFIFVLYSLTNCNSQKSPLNKKISSEFISFIENFTENREKQISFIKTPLIYIYDGSEYYEDKLNNSRLNKDWRFIEKDNLSFEDSVIINKKYPDDERYNTFITWEVSNDNLIVCTLSGYEWSKSLTFEKIENKWYLTKVYSYSL